MKAAVENLLRILFPQENACHLCGRWAEQSVLCARCLQELNRQQIAPDRQLFYRRGCLYSVISCWNHRSVPRRLVHQLKYRADPLSAVLLVEGMAQALQRKPRLLERVEIILPVPLHPEREKDRGYNQAALLARGISRETGIPLREDVLFRTRRTGAMIRLNRAERMEAMHGAFAVAEPDAIRNRCILLVDDVYTTGATSVSCAQTLVHAGAREVHVITACRA